MASDMDIDMDIDLDGDEEFSNMTTAVGDQPSELQSDNFRSQSSSVLLNINELPPASNKVHLRGLDNLTSADIKAFALEYYPEPYGKFEWIDDTSANLIYTTPDISLKALKAFATSEEGILSLSQLQTIPSKPLPAHPDTRLEVRLAVAGDKKQVGAHERSRFYLFNPEYDPAGRNKGDSNHERNARRYRDRVDFKSRTTSAKHGQRRGGFSREFDATFYDDDETSLALRAEKAEHRSESRSSISSGEYKRHRGYRRTSGTDGKELFPERTSKRSIGRLRGRSASPVRDSNGDITLERLPSFTPSRRYLPSDNGKTANRVSAQIIKSKMRETTSQTELFPLKGGSINHRRSDAFDATDSTATLFADQMAVPFVDGSSDSPSKKHDLMSRITLIGEDTRNLEDQILQARRLDVDSFSIRGSAKELPATGFAIKGSAKSASTAKELFPDRVTGNASKELFTEKLEGRGGRRRRAEDMFH